MKHLVVLYLVLGFALAAPAAHLRWIGTNEDANDVGFWDDPDNLDAGTIPTTADKAEVWRSNSTVEVDDFDENTVKKAGNIVLSRGASNLYDKEIGKDFLKGLVKIVRGQ